MWTLLLPKVSSIKSSNFFAESSHEWFRAHFQEFSDNCCQISSFVSNVSRFLDIACLSGNGARRPVEPFRTESLMPATSQPTAGVPKEFASITLIPSPSLIEGFNNTRELW